MDTKEINQIPFEQHRNLTLGHIKALKGESVIIEGHSDPQSYNECWMFLELYVKELYDELIQMPNTGQIFMLSKKF